MWMRRKKNKGEEVPLNLKRERHENVVNVFVGVELTISFMDPWIGIYQWDLMGLDGTRTCLRTCTCTFYTGGGSEWHDLSFFRPRVGKTQERT